jgi:hypothetical protein
LRVQVQKVTQDTKSPFSNFAAERIDDIDVTENLADPNIDIGVDAVKTGGAADPGQPARTPDRICQGSIVLAGGSSKAVFDSCCVPAHPALRERKKIDTKLSLTRRFISGAKIL